MWERREVPFDKDVVLVHEVAEAIAGKFWARYFTPQKIAKTLLKSPIHGTVKVYKADGKTFRAVILRNPHIWMVTGGKFVMDYLNGSGEISVDDDPLLD